MKINSTNKVLNKSQCSFSITEKRTTEDNKLFFKTGEDLPSETIGTAHEDIVLECQAGGKPAASIHWLKNGIRIQQVIIQYKY